ncbi:alpha/beta hydrolase [Schumannella luteola]|uniref:Pimeloyl-ACP methyl ester carboxylesterase n=1 Tax=Schumannella luteola TaxID=472059 RepID=A0A852Y6A2_9MICO|nr:alpha/beta hydrolase [Schumannella luteola]NYG98476.1 pimeloyl-ACP methyl ester carboxylesterase [Schumannella luteola]TPX01298.1 alpha/beta hydrolase [Schumannella luteola]
MPFVTVGTENDTPIEIHYDDKGAGRPIVLLQGFPLTGDEWDEQRIPLLEAGYRVIALDRRGFGRSSRPLGGYDYDTFADDVDAVLRHLDLRDVTLLGFSMGTADIARYVGRHGTERIHSIAMLATFGPQLAARESDPVGFGPEVFEGIKAGIIADRAQYLENYFLQHYVADQNLGVRVSEAKLRRDFISASTADGWAVLHCVDAWQEGFHDDLPKIDVPLLVMQGTEDRNIPIDFGARRIKDFVPSAEVHEIVGGPHGIGVTHTAEVNPRLLEFIGE